MAKQKDDILRYMQEVGEITPVDAMREFSCMRLAARISDLRRDGHKIIAERVRGTNRFGRTVTYAKYRLEVGA